MSSRHENERILNVVYDDAKFLQKKHADIRDSMNQCFANFPIEIWGSITEFMHGEDIARLKLTGDKRIWRILSTKMVVCSVTFGRGFLGFKKWPSFLDELPTIKALKIEDTIGYRTIHDWFELSMLPTTLTKLHLHHFGSHCLHFPNYDWSLSNHLPNLTELSLWREWFPPWSGDYPLLTSLTVLKYYSSVPLPSNLTRLRLLNDLTIVDQVLPFPSLEYFEIDFCPLTLLAPLLSNIPLKTLSISRHRNFAPGTIQQLPRTLTSLGELDYSVVPPNDRVGAPDTLFSKFTNLTRLCAKGLPLKYWYHLPQTLTYLKLVAIDPQDVATDEQIQTYSIDKLPKSIIQLHLEFKIKFPPTLDFDDSNHFDQNVGLFPPKLTHFELIGAYLSVNAAKQLPKTLTVLRFPNLSSEICKHIPTGIIILHCNQTQMTPELVTVLPPSVTDLDLNCRIMGANWIREITPEQALLEKNYEEQSKLLWQGDYLLPLNLQCLTIDMYPFIDDRFFETAQFRILRHLRLPGDQLKNTSILLLPRSLTYFSMSYSQGVTGKSFGHLPRSLTFLELGSINVSDEDIKVLPPTLETLKLPFTGQLTNSCIKNLPRSLEILGLRNCKKITPACFRDLPKRVQHNSSTYFYMWVIQNGEIVDMRKNPVEKAVDSLKAWWTKNVH